MEVWGGVFGFAWFPVRPSFPAHFVGCFFKVFPKQPGRRELFLKFLSITFGRPHFGRVCQVVRSTRFFWKVGICWTSGNFQGRLIDSNIFLVKAGRRFVAYIKFSAASPSLFRKVALVKLWAGIVGPALPFSEVFPRRLGRGWLIGLESWFM